MAGNGKSNRKTTSRKSRKTRTREARQTLAREKRLESRKFGRRARDKRDKNGTNLEGLPGFRKGLNGEIAGSGPGKNEADLRYEEWQKNHPPIGSPSWMRSQCELEMSDKLKKLESDRGKIYGDPYLSHQAIGLAWEGVFRNRYHFPILAQVRPGIKVDIPIKVGEMFPADLVAEMLAAFKIVRLARPIFHQDSADDAKVYISFSERFRKQ